MCLSIAKQYFVHTVEPLCVRVDDEDGDPNVCMFSSFFSTHPSFILSHPFQDKDIAIVLFFVLMSIYYINIYMYVSLHVCACVCVCRPQSPSLSVGGQQQESLLVFFLLCVSVFFFFCGSLSNLIRCIVSTIRISSCFVVSTEFA